MFNKKFEIVEIRESGVRVTHRLSGKKSEVKKDIEAFKGIAKDYMMVGKTGMIVWV